jgi:Acyl-CoA hydrolase
MECKTGPKRVKDSSVVVVQQMVQQDANLAGNVHGGVIMKLIDNTAGIVAIRHSCGIVVTASLDRLDFHSPVYVGNLLRLIASINMVGRTSMEIGVRVEAEDLYTGEVRHTASSYLTFVALDANQKPRPVPELLLETEDETRRNREAIRRRELRNEERKREKNSKK